MRLQNALHKELSETLQELDCKLRKQEGSIGRRIEQLQKQQAAKLEKAGRLLEEIAVRASKLPGVADLLKSWL